MDKKGNFTEPEKTLPIQNCAISNHFQIFMSMAFCFSFDQKCILSNYKYIIIFYGPKNNNHNNRKQYNNEIYLLIAIFFAAHAHLQIAFRAQLMSSDFPKPNTLEWSF